MKRWLLPLLLAGCATTSTRATATDAPMAQLPRWVDGPATDDAAAVTRTLPPVERRFETVALRETPPRDPVDVVLSRSAGRQRLRSFALREAPVADTLQMFARMGGFNLVVGDDVPARTVTLSLRDVTLAGAFRAVLAATHLGAVALDEGVLHVRPSVAQR